MEINIKLKEKKGNMIPFAVAIVLALLIIFTSISEYLRLKIIAAGIKEVIQSSVITISIENYENVYSSNREGYSSGHKYDNDRDEWKEEIDIGDVYKEMNKLLNLDKQGEYYVKTSSEGYEYRLSDLKVNIINSPLKSSSDKFQAESYINLEVPLSFGWEHLPSMKIRLKVKSEYMAMF